MYMLVSNTSTLVLLAKVGCLEKFIEISPIIEIPVQVKKEALFERDSYYAKLIEKLIQEKKIRIVPADKDKLVKITSEFRLDDGEAAAYALFDYKKHKARHYLVYTVNKPGYGYYAINLLNKPTMSSRLFEKGNRQKVFLC